MLRYAIAASLSSIVLIAVALLLGIRFRTSEPSASERSLVEARPQQNNSQMDIRFGDVPSCESDQRKIRMLISDSKHCMSDSECELLSPGCPFGCVESVLTGAATKIEESYENYSRRCQSCVYMCANSPLGRYASCDENGCVVKEKEREALEVDTFRLLSKPDS
jgi:hypothetical protein